MRASVWSTIKHVTGVDTAERECSDFIQKNFREREREREDTDQIEIQDSEEMVVWTELGRLSTMWDSKMHVDFQRAVARIMRDKFGMKVKRKVSIIENDSSISIENFIVEP